MKQLRGKFMNEMCKSPFIFPHFLRLRISQNRGFKIPFPPPQAYWYTLDDILTKYVRHSDNKFEYDNEGIAHRKHIVVNRIRYIGKESNNIDDNLTGIEDPDYLEYENIKEFEKWILSLKPKDVAGDGISQRALYYQKSLIRNGKILNKKQKIVKKLLYLYNKTKINFENRGVYYSSAKASELASTQLSCD
jgi:hypothetical protein